MAYRETWLLRHKKSCSIIALLNNMEDGKSEGYCFFFFCFQTILKVKQWRGKADYMMRYAATVFFPWRHIGLFKTESFFCHHRTYCRRHEKVKIDCRYFTRVWRRPFFPIVVVATLFSTGGRPLHYSGIHRREGVYQRQDVKRQNVIIIFKGTNIILTTSPKFDFQSLLCCGTHPVLAFCVPPFPCPTFGLSLPFVLSFVRDEKGRKFSKVEPGWQHSSLIYQVKTKKSWKLCQKIFHHF